MREMLCVIGLGFLAAFTSQPSLAEGNSLRIPRPTGSAVFSYNDACLKQFEVWLREYRHPAVCPVYFCHGGCAQGDLPCPSFLGKRVLDPESNDLMMSGSCCGGPAEMMAGARQSMDCCR